MGTPNPIKINLKFNEKDADIFALIEYYSLRKAIYLAVQNYLGKTENRLKLPPTYPIQTSWRRIVIHKEDDIDTYQLLQQIPPRCQGHAIKLLLRHAMENCDLRFLIQLQQKETTESKTGNPSSKQSKMYPDTNKKKKNASVSSQERPATMKRDTRIEAVRHEPVKAEDDAFEFI